jgi:ATP-dependent DNA ligase
VPSGPRWIHEIKFDGYRVQAHIKDGKVKVFTRRGNDWSSRFRKIAADAFEVDAGSPSSMAKSLCQGRRASRTFLFCRMS